MCTPFDLGEVQTLVTSEPAGPSNTAYAYAARFKSICIPQAPRFESAYGYPSAFWVNVGAYSYALVCMRLVCVDTNVQKGFNMKDIDTAQGVMRLCCWQEVDEVRPCTGDDCDWSLFAKPTHSKRPVEHYTQILDTGETLSHCTVDTAKMPTRATKTRKQYVLPCAAMALCSHNAYQCA